jgi:hypothetical protein
MSYTFIHSKNEMSEGLFGMVILWVFEVLPILESNNVDISTLKWDISTASYGAIFPNLLEYNSEYISPEKINKNDKVVKLFGLRKEYRQYVLGDDFNKLHDLFFKYFKIPKNIEKIADQYDLTNYLGLHFRGTDKTRDTFMNNPLTKSDFYIIIDSFIKANTGIMNVFLATDEMDILSYLKNKYTHINFITSRDLKNNLFWRNNSDVIRNGTEAMVDMLCLSKCKIVLKVSSALSSFSKLINPNLNIYRLNALKMFVDIPYFPDAYIPLLEKNENYTDECNKILDKIQQNDWSITHKQKFNNFYCKLR